ncbi:LRR [Seminavis robusta]|uniref:LRR n=1 Tax=Seminavis robusta TaxID=568900 RepID=A0A9N8H7D6_9STRA|nr:LRR [Seminavis robusta]|eukprot:Sro125_g060380.1 LRR (792) ;mRNA; f:102093-104468
MLLASPLLSASRPPLRALTHMGEHSQAQSALLIPVSADVCLSNPDEGNETLSQDPPLRPRNSGTMIASTTTVAAEALPKLPAMSTFHRVDDGETCSSEAPPKAASVLTTSQAQTPSREIDAVVGHGDEAAEVAVREDAEGNEKEQDSVSQGERESPSPSPSLTLTSSRSAMRTQKLASALKTTSLISGADGTGSNKKKGRHQRTKRRIRGIWGGDDSTLFSQLHDETILLIMKNFSMKDLCVASMVCQRWKHLALHQDSWKRIDATEFVQAAHDYYAKMDCNTDNSDGKIDPPKSTSKALAAHVEKFTPLSLSIHSIHNRLSPDNFLSSLPSLQELTLTAFAELTDTHVHVLLLSCVSKRSCNLRKLALEQCPRLTNATVQSIGKLCSELEELSLAGNSNITDLAPLSDLWVLTTKPSPPVAAAPKRVAASPAAASMFSLFSPPPPPPPKPSLADMFQPPRPSTPTSTSSLQSLFAPPGESPPRSANVIRILPQPLSKKNSKIKQPAKLALINVSNTGVTAKSLIAAWKAAVPSGKIVRLAHLLMNGTGETWKDTHLRDIADLLDLVKLESLDIGCRNSSSRTVTDSGLAWLVQGAESVTSNKAPLSSLVRLNLSGHQSLSGTCIANTIAPAQGRLEELTLKDCKGLSVQSANVAKDLASIDTLAKAISSLTVRETNEKDAAGGKGLRRLSLAGCFSNQCLLQRNNNKKMHEETIGSILLESLGPQTTKKGGKATKQHDNLLSCSTASTTLVELDLTGCWFVTPSHVASLRERCPRLHKIHLDGTRAMQAM